jgi:2'-5' RNA ligase
MVIHQDYFDQTLSERRQKKYAVVIFLPEHLDNIIMPVREKFDPLYNQVPSHISLVFPFESDLFLDELTPLIKSETEKQKKLIVHLHSIGDFYPKYPIIYWDVMENTDLKNLYFQLYTKLNLSVPYKQYQPHVTIAREISNHRLMLVKDTIAPYLPTERFESSSVDLITPLAGTQWVSVRTFGLNG